MDDLLLRYRLALTLIPDPDAAGDLFMTARSEMDLRRRAARWREQAGLPPAEGSLLLVTLTDEQREHALHLARRGAAHRRLKGWLAAAITLLVLVGAGYLGYEGVKPQLDADPAFAAQPLASVTGPGDLTLTVYKAEVASPDSALSIWWELKGAGAADRARRLAPELGVGTTRVSWFDQVATRFYSARPDRVLAVTRFAVKLPGVEAIFRIERGRLGEEDFMVVFRMPHPPQPVER